MTVCSAYNTPSSVWPRQPFPPILGSVSFGTRASAIKAWEYYELVEFTDAQTRLRITAHPLQHIQSAFPPSRTTWWPLNTQANRLLYRRGQLLHLQACPGINWTSQRYLGPVVDNNVVPAPL